MIEAIFDKHEDALSLRLTGHAGYAEHGKDIICASASILVYTVAQMMTDLFVQGKMVENPMIRLVDGYAVVKSRPTKEGYSDALQTLLVAQTGFELLHHNYPDYVHVIKIGEALKP